MHALNAGGGGGGTLSSNIHSQLFANRLLIAHCCNGAGYRGGDHSELGSNSTRGMCRTRNGI